MDEKQSCFYVLGICLLTLIVISACVSEPISRMNNGLLKKITEVVENPAQVPLTPTTEFVLDQSPTPDNSDSDKSEEVKSEEMITISIVFDNYSVRQELSSAWGFAAFVSYQDHNVLFDTGAAGSTLLNNMAAMGIKPDQIQNIVLSHQHNDHTGGLQAVLSGGAEPTIYLLRSFSATFKNQYKNQAIIVEVSPGQKISDRIFSTGEIQGSPPEQALVIDTTRGLVVITGCAHPGVEKMVKFAKQTFQEEIYLVLGGFHLNNASTSQVNRIIKELQRLGVEHVAPCHCTGDRAIAQFKDAFGDQFIKIGVGAVIEIEN
jgi:7,8-dihydropterin-6-yl-methyl-4-(beta-D-ribofuranosyl)aminobenzene 5'-phosphate synthase